MTAIRIGLCLLVVTLAPASAHAKPTGKVARLRQVVSKRQAFKNLLKQNRLLRTHFAERLAKQRKRGRHSLRAKIGLGLLTANGAWAGGYALEKIVNDVWLENGNMGFGTGPIEAITLKTTVTAVMTVAFALPTLGGVFGAAELMQPRRVARARAVNSTLRRARYEGIALPAILAAELK